MRHTFLNFAGAATLAAGMLFAQTPNPARRQAGGHGEMMQRLSTDLNLTQAQQDQARTIFGNARQQSEPVRQQLHQQRQALDNAVKSNAPASEIDKLANQTGPLEAQLTAIRAKSMEQFRQILTPAQTAKLDAMHAQRLNRFKGGHAQQGATPSE